MTCLISFSILCTNSQNGGQTELLIEAENATQAAAHVVATRPHFIVKKIDEIERSFVCIGIDMRLDFHKELAYWTSSAHEARAICQRLHPDFAIDRVEQR